MRWKAHVMSGDRMFTDTGRSMPEALRAVERHAVRRGCEKRHLLCWWIESTYPELTIVVGGIYLRGSALVQKHWHKARKEAA